MEKVCKESEVSKGTMKGFTVKGKQILIANVGGVFYAMDAICSHMKGYLPSGVLSNNKVICPVHKAEFDVMTGKVLKNVDAVIKTITGKEATDLKVYKTSVKKGIVFVEI